MALATSGRALRYAGRSGPALIVRLAIGLGSNLGDRLSWLREGAEKVEHHLHETGAPFLLSRIYKNNPVDCEPGTPFFYNAAIELECSMPPMEVLHRVQSIEEECGRPAKHGFHTPRTLDLDLLYYGIHQLDTPGLILPHPRIHTRAFVLAPLSDISRTTPLPGFSATPAQLLAKISGETDLQIASTDWKTEISLNS